MCINFLTSLSSLWFESYLHRDLSFFSWQKDCLASICYIITCSCLRLKGITGSMQRWSSMMISTFLLLSFFSVGLAQTTGSAIDENDSYPPFWDHIRGDIAEFPVQNNKIIIDPWKYINRLQIFKILMKKLTNILFHLEKMVQAMYSGHGLYFMQHYLNRVCIFYLFLWKTAFFYPCC